jgi:serine/threonine protein kinase
MAGGRGKVNTINRLAETRLYKTLNNPIELKLDGIKPNGEPKLRRGNGVGSAYLENKVPGIVRPEIYVIKEIRSDGSDAFHAVTGDKNYKNWAANFLSKNPNSKLFLGAIVMPRASGHELMTIRPDKTIYVAPVDPKILFGAARNGLGTLKDMSSGGFVHGDLKGPNIFIDENTKTLQFIDVDEITKMRKNQNTGCTVSKTPAYSHPNTMIGKIGFEQDLMGLGVTTLYTAFNSRGEASGAVPADKLRANELLSVIKNYNTEFKELENNIPNSAKNSDPDFLNLRSKIEALLPPHPSPVEIMALNWIQAALDQKTPLTTRYGSDGSVQHLLDRMDPEINPDIARRLDLRTNAGAQPQPQRQAQPDQQPRQPAAAIRGGAAAAVDNKADVKQLNPNALRNGIQDGLNDIYGIMDDMFKKEELPRKLGDKVYGLVDDWANSKQGRDTIELAVKDQMAESVEKGNIRIKDLLIDRFNLEHFRMTLNEDATLKDLSAENRTKLENKVINSKATYEKTEIYTLDMLANRIQRQRIILKL